MQVRVVQRLLVIAYRCVRVAQRPAGAPFADAILQLLGYAQVPQMILDGRRIVPQESVRVAQGVAGLRLHFTVAQLLRED